MPEPSAATGGRATGRGVVGEDRSVALAFVNSRRNGPLGPVDTIAEPAGLDQWLDAHDLTAQPGATADDLVAAALLREAVRAVLAAAAAGARPGGADVAAVNAAATGSPGAPRLEVAGRQLRLGWTSIGGGVADALAAIARDAITVVTSELGSRVHECAAADCVRLFLPDRISRTWCSTTCGNRVRAARHYARLSSPS